MGRPIRIIQLDEESRLALSSGFKTGKKAVYRKRCHFILLSDQGYSMEEIASIYSTNRQSVAVWFDRYEATGIDGLHTRKGQGEKPILEVSNSADVERVKRLVAQHAQDLAQVLLEQEEETGKSMSKRTLQRFLKKLVTSGNAFVE